MGNYVRVDVDAAMLDGNMIILGIVVRNGVGEVVATTIKQVRDVGSVKGAEAMAVRLGTLFALNLGYRQEF
uniref:RNase H type-1 domain-containing protein n=1 Tax=Chenopodium quinoa TaxID=63459 RepID=A0A803L0F0_CHEQI